MQCLSESNIHFISVLTYFSNLTTGYFEGLLITAPSTTQALNSCEYSIVDELQNKSRNLPILDE